MNREVQDLTLGQLDAVAGGLTGLEIAGAIAIGVAGNAVYEFMKDHQGVKDVMNWASQHQK